VLFRFFDIVKPWPIREADHSLAGGLGIMLDDIIAGLFAGAILLATKLLI
jgi:phosphatidylglycerophosphatase A